MCFPSSVPLTPNSQAVSGGDPAVGARWLLLPLGRGTAWETLKGPRLAAGPAERLGWEGGRDPPAPSAEALMALLSGCALKYRDNSSKRHWK